MLHMFYNLLKILESIFMFFHKKHMQISSALPMGVLNFQDHQGSLSPQTIPNPTQTGFFPTNTHL